MEKKGSQKGQTAPQKIWIWQKFLFAIILQNMFSLFLAEQLLQGQPQRQEVFHSDRSPQDSRAFHQPHSQHRKSGLSIDHLMFCFQLPYLNC